MGSYCYESMYPYQRAGAHFVRRNGCVLIADQPGLGKTIQALGAIIATAAQEDGPGRPASNADVINPQAVTCRWHLVVTPKVAIHNVWEPEVHRWLHDKDAETLCLTGTLAEREEALSAFVPQPETRHVFVIINIESMRVKPVEDKYRKALRVSLRQIIRFSVNVKGKGKVKMAYHPENCLVPGLLNRFWDTVICDESHRAVIRTQHVPTQVRAGFMLVRSHRRLALSGTPMRGKPEQLWGTLNWLRPDLYRSFWNWAKLYFEVIMEKGIPVEVGGLTESGKRRLARDLQTIMLRRTKEEVAPDLPPKTYAGYHLIEGDDTSPLGVWLEMVPKQKRQYDRLILDGLIGHALVNGTLAEYTRARQIAGGLCEVDEIGDEKVVLRVVPDESPKFEWLTEWLDQNEGEKVIVVSQYTDTVLVPYEEALAGLGHEVVAITGKTPDRKRTEAVEAFQNGTARVCLLNVKAGGVALTLDSADYVVFLDESSIPDTDEQAEDRAHRISRMHNVTVYKLRMLDTIEEEVAYIAAARQDVQRYLLDGARGVEYAKQVYLTSRTDAAKKESTE